MAGVSKVRVLGVTLAVLFAAAPAHAVERSRGMFVIPYKPGTSVAVTRDHTNHKPKNRYDMHGEGGTAPYAIVAAAPGTVRHTVDSYSEARPDGEPCNNNYVWIEHANGSGRSTRT